MLHCSLIFKCCWVLLKLTTFIYTAVYGLKILEFQDKHFCSPITWRHLAKYKRTYDAVVFDTVSQKWMSWAFPFNSMLKCKMKKCHHK